MAYRVIHVGVGGMGSVWCRQFYPPNIQDGLIEVVAAVDVDPSRLHIAREALGLPDDRCYTDIHRAADEVAADICVICTPSSMHEEGVEAALAHGMHILSEKPIAHTLAGSCRVAEKVTRAGKKMGVTMTHRFDQDKTTLREEIRSGRHGPVDYVTLRFTCDCRKPGAWTKSGYPIPDSLMVEGAVHHLDIIADLAGARCDAVFAQIWNPAWGERGGDSQALVMMTFENGVRGFYEGGRANAVGLNWWAHEYIRAECEKATLVLDWRELECFAYDPGGTRAKKRAGDGERVPLIDQPKWGNAWLVEKFVRWLDGGEPMETNVEDNLQSVALVFSAIESNRTGQPVKVQEFLEAARAEARRQIQEQ